VDGTRRLPISPLIDTYLVPEAPQGARSDPIPPLATTSAIGHVKGMPTRIRADFTWGSAGLRQIFADSRRLRESSRSGLHLFFGGFAQIRDAFAKVSVVVGSGMAVCEVSIVPLVVIVSPTSLNRIIKFRNNEKFDARGRRVIGAREPTEAVELALGKHAWCRVSEF
jgi:hypothetical protein